MLLHASVIPEAIGSEPSIHEAATVLMSRLVGDLYEWTDSSWAIAIRFSRGDLFPVCVLGTQPDLPACLEYVRALLPCDGSVIRELIQTASTDHSWTPHIIVPICMRGETCGAWVFGPKRRSLAYTSADRQLMNEGALQTSRILESESLACRIAASLASMHRIGIDLKMARYLQSCFFPRRFPTIEGCDYFGECRPAGALGGDFFDFVPLRDSALVVSVGDVCGKGVPAALVMAGIQACLRALTTAGSEDLTQNVRELNRILCERAPDYLFVTLFYASIDLLRQRLHFVSAGHETALLLRRRIGRIHRLGSTATVLALSNRTVHQQRAVPLERGDVLVAFTDGITEAADSEGRQLHEELVIRVLCDYPEAPARDLVGRIIDAIDAFTGRPAARDDRTVVAVRFTGRAEGVPIREASAQLAAAAA